MKVQFLGVALALAIPAAASAQVYQPYRPIPYQRTQPPPERPSSGSTYDYQSGNSYHWRRNADGSTSVNGYNLQNGTTWNSRVQPNGNQSGTDSRGNLWNYDARSGSYMNSDGTICIGTGALRTCN